VRSHQLEAALTAFLEEAARYLQTDISCGAEVGFEVERRGVSVARTPLYCYRPLTSEFLGERWRALGGLGTHGPAVAQLEHFEGLARYLSIYGDARGRPGSGGGRSEAEVGLWMLLEEVFAEQSDFELHPERVVAALERLHRCATASAGESMVVAELHGMTISSLELPLSATLRIAQPRALQEMPEEVLPVGPTDEIDHLLVVHTSEHDDAVAAGADGRAALRQLLCALRLFGDGRVALGELAWARAVDGRWRPIALRLGGRPYGMLVVTESQEDELRAFCNLVSRRAPVDNELAWALRRFQLGCEREREGEALSDYVLALRALLEPEGSPRGVLAGRLAALCVVPERRGELTERVARALELEQAVICGRAVENAAAERLVRDLADNLRALLRDVICGHLDSDLAALADELLLDTELPPAPREAEPDGTQPVPAQPAPAGVVAGAWEERADWGEDDDPHARVEAAGAPQAQRLRTPIRMAREPMPVADELDEEQLRLIGMPG
jgi:hypothetical protein